MPELVVDVELFEVSWYERRPGPGREDTIVTPIGLKVEGLIGVLNVSEIRPCEASKLNDVIAAPLAVGTTAEALIELDGATGAIGLPAMSTTKDAKDRNV